jgi:hypothetical protein
VIIGASRALDGHRVTLRELDPPPIAAFVEPSGEAWADGGSLLVRGWALSASGHRMQGRLVASDGTRRQFACGELIPEVPRAVTGFERADPRCGFTLSVELPDWADALTVVVELDDGELVAESAPLRIRRRRDARRLDAPTAESALGIFAGEWESLDPASPTFVDPLLDDALAALAPAGSGGGGGVAGASVAELGSGEGVGAVVLERHDAASVVGIEPDADAFVRSLVVKEVAGLRRTRLLHGGIGAYLREPGAHFDVAIALDVVHRETEPLATLAHLVAIADRVAIWLRCFDGERIDALGHLRDAFTSPPVERDLDGHTFLVHRHADGGGWIERGALLDALDVLGCAADVVEGRDVPDDPGGPSCLVIARRA